MSEPAKKMSLVQLTFIVAVNMMGSGIIMLPTNMAQGRRDLAAVLDRDGARLDGDRLRLRPGRHLFNQRPGGMSAYAEDAYGKAGYFHGVLPLLPLAGDRQRGDRDLGGRLPGRPSFPWLSSTPVATCIGVIALLWLTTVANFGGPSLTGRIGVDNGLGRHPPGRAALADRLVLVQAATFSRRPGTRRD